MDRRYVLLQLVGTQQPRARKYSSHCHGSRQNACHDLGSQRHAGLGGRSPGGTAGSGPGGGRHRLHGGQNGGSEPGTLGGVQSVLSRFHAEEENQQRQRRRAVELGPALLQALHARLDGFPCVVQPAFNGALAGLHGLGDLFDAHLIVVVEQYAHPLFRRQSVDDFQHQPPGFLVVQRRLRDGLLVQVLQLVQHTAAVLVLRNLPLPFSAGQQVLAPVGGDAVDPAVKGGGLLELVQAGEDRDQHILRGVLCVTLIFHHFLAVVVDPVLNIQDQRLLRLGIPCPGSLNQGG